MIELQALTDHDLRELLRRVESELTERERRRRKDAAATIRRLAEQAGIRVHVSTAGGRQGARARYRHPERPSLTWSGRGRPPRWLVEYEQEGGSRESCRVEEEDA